MRFKALSGCAVLMDTSCFRPLLLIGFRMAILLSSHHSFKKHFTTRRYSGAVNRRQYLSRPHRCFNGTEHVIKRDRVTACVPKEALDRLLRTKLDMLALGDTLLFRQYKRWGLGLAMMA